MRKQILLMAAALLAAPLTRAAAPVVVCPAAATLECTNGGGALVLDATVMDADGDALMVIWMVQGAPVQTNVVASGITTNGVILSLTNTFALGTNEVAIGVTDDGTNVVSCATTIVIADTTPPVIDVVTATPNSIWPPNHKLKDVNIRVDAHDDCGPVTWRVMSVESNEPVDGIGDGNTAPDWVINGPHSVKVRSERAGPGIGRTYTIRVQVLDVSTNSAEGTVRVFVPHDRGHGKFKDPADDEDNGGNGNGKGKGNGNGNGNGNGKGKGKK